MNIDANMTNEELKGECQLLHGISVIEDTSCLRETKRSSKYLPSKSWHWHYLSKYKDLKRAYSVFSYREKINKKWCKRYGVEMEPTLYKTTEGYRCHPILSVRLHFWLSLGLDKGLEDIVEATPDDNR